LLFLVLAFAQDGAAATDKLTGFYSARTMSQSMPWIAEEAGLFRKYQLDFQLVYISSAPMVTAALLGGDAQIAISGGEAIVRASDPFESANRSAGFTCVVLKRVCR